MKNSLMKLTETSTRTLLMKLILILSYSSNLYFSIPNNDSTPYSPITLQTPSEDSEIPSIKSIADFTLGLMTSTKKAIQNVERSSAEKYIDTIYEKIKIESFRENIL